MLIKHVNILYFRLANLRDYMADDCESADELKRLMIDEHELLYQIAELEAKIEDNDAR